MRLDLHIHTTASDGAFDADRIVAAAVKGGLTVIAITDHDTTAGVGPARAAAEGTPLTVLAGTELSSTHEGEEVHVLGYGIDPSHPSISGHRERARTRRVARMEAMLGRLEDLGLTVTLDEVFAQAGPEGEMLGRPHLARVLVERGVVPDLPTAFDRYLANNGPAYVATDLQTPFEAIEAVREAGGISSWAHPPPYLFDPLYPRLVDAGLGGIEAFRPHNPLPWTRALCAAAEARGIMVTGGSDWHNLERNEPLGTWWLEPEHVGALASALGLPVG